MRGRFGENFRHGLGEDAGEREGRECVQTKPLGTAMKSR